MPDSQPAPAHVPAPSPQVDLTSCDREPIHALGHVQPFGCLLTLSTDWVVAHASANATEVLGLDGPTEALIGTPLAQHLPPEAIRMLQGRIQTLMPDQGPVRLFGADLMDDGRLWDVAVHLSGRLLVIEVEPVEPSARRGAGGGPGRDDLSLIQPLMARIGRGGSVETLCREATRVLKALTGFDRVMVYRFAPDASGSVIAESASPGMEPYLGLRYPASDIPVQARRLYERSPLRLIADVDARVSPIVPSPGPEEEPLDLSLAVTRAVSPIHLEYLRNMGVAASMSVSILHRGRLWGLFACHHRTSRHVGYETRTACELFAQLFSYELAQREADLERVQAERAQKLHDRLVARVSSGGDVARHFDALVEEIAEVIPHDGIALWSEGRYASHGSAPTAEEFAGLARHLNGVSAGRVFATDSLMGTYPPAEGFLDRAAGALALPISRGPRDFIVLFRREVARVVRWAGDPVKPASVGPNGVRLTPRKSFEAWQQVVHGRAEPWSTAERGAAEALRVTLLEVVLKLTEEAAQERKRAQESQELLIAELNHRVRNILKLIQGLVTRSRSDARDLHGYVSVLGGRIQALARAHDQITQDSWGPASIKELIAVELEAYLDGQTERVRVSGPDSRLEAEACSTVALVVHELATNSAKYGALTDSKGHVSVALGRTPAGAVTVAWREHGGPPVRAPARRGFGTTIIERSIPYELGGRAETRFRVTGLEADFTIPARHASDAGEDDPRPVQNAAASDAPPAGTARIDGPALVVEDNLIIAMDAVDALEALGAAPVHTASSVADALDVLTREPIVLGLLDVNLGGETSAEVAQTMAARRIPFALATGYGEADLAGAYPGAPVLKKPFDDETLRRAVALVLSGPRADD